jgi:hypothetical protein
VIEIETDTENERAIAELQRPDSVAPKSAEQKSLADLLTVLIERFEHRCEIGHAEPLDRLHAHGTARIAAARSDRGLRVRQCNVRCCHREARDQ